MEQILIRGLPEGTKASLRVRAQRHDRSVEAEARAMLTEGLRTPPVTLVDLIRADDTADIEFEPERLRFDVRDSELGF